MEASSVSSRRGLLGRGLLVAAGVLGLGSATRHSPTAGTVAAVAARRTELTLYGRHLHLHAPDATGGRAAARRATATRRTRSCSTAPRAGVGHFSAAHLSLDSPFAAASSLEIHTFDLPGGTIHGLGSAVTRSRRPLRVLGGTGRYTGATGSYLARRLPRELGGDGTAEFHLTLAGMEVGHGL